MLTFRSILAFAAVALLMVGSVWAADPAPAAKAAKDQVMPAKQRQQIVMTAKALFEPQVKNSIKIGKVSSPFAPSTVK